MPTATRRSARGRSDEGVGRCVAPEVDHHVAGVAEEVGRHRARQGVAVAGEAAPTTTVPRWRPRWAKRGPIRPRSRGPRRRPVLVGHRQSPAPQRARRSSGRDEQLDVDLRRRGPGGRASFDDGEGPTSSPSTSCWPACRSPGAGSPPGTPRLGGRRSAPPRRRPPARGPPPGRRATGRCGRSGKRSCSARRAPRLHPSGSWWPVGAAGGCAAPRRWWRTSPVIPPP